MVNPQLLEYVRRQFAAGISKEDIAKSLVAIGWQTPDINEALAVLPSPAAVVAPPTVQTAPARVPPQNAVPPAHPFAARWVIAIVLLVVIGAGGAFAAYYFRVFTPRSATSDITPLSTLANTTGATSTSAVPVPAFTSSTPQPPPINAGPSSTANLPANSALPLPSASLTVNNAASVTAKAATYTFTWSSTNADTFSATESASNCLISVMNKTDTALTGMSSARGTRSLFTFTKNDLALLSGCVVTITFHAENTKTAQKAEAAVTISFPSDSTTIEQLINMTPLWTKAKSASSASMLPATAPISAPSVPPPPAAAPVSAPSVPSPTIAPVTIPPPPTNITSTSSVPLPPPPVIPPPL